MSHYCRDVQLFHNKFGVVTPSDFTFITQNLFNFRVKFFYEELTEYTDAVVGNDLGTAIDSLIDLVYIACGTSLLHGIGFDRFNDLLETVDQSSLFEVNLAPTGRPHLLSPEHHVRLSSLLHGNIEAYIDAYTVKSELGIKRALGSLYMNCLFASTAMDLSNEQWDEMWADVQRANMSKERAKSATESKRGAMDANSYDIIKPAGWVGPRTEELLKKYLTV